MANNSIIKTIRNLGPLAAAITQAAQRVQGNLYQAPAHRIANINESNWPTALQPAAPFSQGTNRPLINNLTVGQNLIYTPRADMDLKAPDLKRLADYPLARICIENVKDIICEMPWRVQATRLSGETQEAHKKRQLNDKTIPVLTKFLKYPNPDPVRGNWRSFARILIEDMLVGDWASIFLRRSNDGKQIKEMYRLPGENIVQYFNDNGIPDPPPSVAYAQIYDGGLSNGTGIPVTEFTTAQLVYKPRNIVPGNTPSSQFYGNPPTAQLAPEIKIGIERLKYVMSFYTTGSTNGVVQVIPNGVPPDDVRRAVEAYNAENAGNFAARRGLKWIQGFSQDGKDTIMNLPEPVLADVFDDLHIRKICFGYGVSPQRLLKMMNRATAGENQDASEEEGIAPWVSWLVDVINYIIQVQWGLDGYEFVMNQDRQGDILKQREADAIDVKNGIRPVNDILVDRGLDPRPEPEANMLGIVTGTGWVPVSGSMEAAQASREAVAQPDKGKEKDSESDEEDEPAEKLAKAGKSKPVINPARLTRTGKKAKKSIERIVHRYLSKLSSGFIDKLESSYKNTAKAAKLAKANDDKERQREIEILIDGWIAALDWSDLPELIEGDLAEVSIEAATDGVTVWGVTQTSVINKVNARAAGYARDRSAEMVGKKWVDGELLDNPNAQWAISDTTRDRLRKILTDAFMDETPLDSVIQQIMDTALFSESRAQMIAKTEVANAMVRGNLDGWEAAGVVGTMNWRLAGNHLEPDECDFNAENGPYSFDELPEYPNHPNEMCTLVPARLKGESDEDTKKVWVVRFTKACERIQLCTR